MHPLVTRLYQGEKPDFETFVETWGNIFPLLHKLKETPQDPEWHGEGNVHIHTSMVLEETYKRIDKEASHLSQEQKIVLIIGAVFHDIAKTITTRKEVIKGKERIVSPKHPDLGRSYLAYKLPALGLPYNTMQNVLMLVGHHHDPNRLVRKNRPMYSWKKLARLAQVQLLYHLEYADLLGRKCSDLKEQLEQLELFKMFCQEYQVWDQAPYEDWQRHILEALKDKERAFQRLALAHGIREVEKGDISTPHEAVAKSFHLRQPFSHLIITCGASGSGKSTWIAKNATDYELISLDELRTQITGSISNQSKNGQVLQKAQQLLKQHLSKQKNIVWGATNLRSDFRRRIVQLGYDYGAYVSLVVFHLNEEEIRQRNRKRAHPIPGNILERQFEMLEWPYCNEAHEVIYVDEKGEKL